MKISEYAILKPITTVMKSNLTEFDALADLFDGTGITWQIQIANKGGARFSRENFISRRDYAWLVKKMRAVYANRRETLHLQWMDDFGYFPLDPKLRFLHQTWHGCIAADLSQSTRGTGPHRRALVRQPLQQSRCCGLAPGLP